MIYAIVGFISFCAGAAISRRFWWRIFLDGFKRGAFDDIVDQMRKRRSKTP